jgi:hypothetical protein
VGFLKGQPRPEGSGRQKGTPNKKTVAKVSDYLGEQGINPAEEVLKIINEKQLVANREGLMEEKFVLASAARADLWLELLSFCHAKPKTLEIKQSDPDVDTSEFDDVSSEALLQVLNKSISGTA